MNNPGHPAIVGVAQQVQRVDDPREAVAPIDLMESALRAAAADAGAPALLEALDAIWLPQGIWRYADPGRILAERVGSPGAETGVGSVSGHIVQVMLDERVWAKSDDPVLTDALVADEDACRRPAMLRDGEIELR